MQVKRKKIFLASQNNSVDFSNQRGVHIETKMTPWNNLSVNKDVQAPHLLCI